MSSSLGRYDTHWDVRCLSAKPQKNQPCAERPKLREMTCQMQTFAAIRTTYSTLGPRRAIRLKLGRFSKSLPLQSIYNHKHQWKNIIISIWIMYCKRQQQTHQNLADGEIILRAFPVVILSEMPQQLSMPS